MLHSWKAAKERYPASKPPPDDRGIWRKEKTYLETPFTTLDHYKTSSAVIHSCPSDIQLRLLVEFCRFLIWTKPPANHQSWKTGNLFEQLAKKEEVDKALYSFAAMRNLRLGTDSRGKDWNIAFSKAIRDTWKGTFRWMKYFCAVVIEVEGDGDGPMAEADKQELIVALYSVLSWFDMDIFFRDRMLKTPGIYKLAAAIWLAADEITFPAVDHPIASETLGSIVGHSKTEGVQEIHEACKGRPDHIVSTLLLRLQTALQKPSINPHHVGSFLLLLAYLQHKAILFEAGYYQAIQPDGRTNSIAWELQRSGAITLATRALYLMSRGPLHQHEKTPKAVQNGLMFILRAIEDDHTCGTVLKSVRAGLIPFLVAWGPSVTRMAEFVRCAVPRILGHSLPRHLVYRKVLRAVKPYVLQLTGPEIDADMEKSPKDVKQSWYAFRLYALQRLYIRAAEKLTVSRWCEQCMDAEKASDLYRCSSCHVALFCSKKCQRAAWSSHRSKCLELQRQQNSGNKGFIRESQDDRALLGALMTRDAIHARAQLSIEAAKAFPDIPVAETFIVIDYNVAPPALDIHPLVDYHARISELAVQFETEDELRVSERDIEEIRKGRKTLIFGRLPGMDAHHLMEGLLWDEEVLGPEGVPVACVATMRELAVPRLRKLIEGLREEVTSRYADIEKTWLIQGKSRAAKDPYLQQIRTFKLGGE